MKRRKYQKQKIDSKKNGVSTSLIKKILIWILCIASLSYIVYFFVVLSGIKIIDPISENSSNHYLLSKNKSDLERTLILFEDGVGEKRRISDVFLLFSNSEKDISLVTYVPGDIYFSGLEENFGAPIQISSLRYAGDFLQENRGVEYSVWQMGQILGVKVDNYIWLTTESRKVLERTMGGNIEVQESFKEYYKNTEGATIGENFLLLHGLSNRFSYLKFFLNASDIKGLDKTIYTNLTLLKALSKIATFKNIVRNGDTYAIDLSSPTYLDDKLSERGGQITTINTENFDKAFRSFYMKVLDRGLEEERVRVEVYNGSGIPGSAYQLGRKIENSGCDVVRYGNAPKNISKTTVYIPQPESFSNSLSVVKEILSGMYEEVNGRPDFMTTGDIVIVLGEDIKLMYSF